MVNAAEHMEESERLLTVGQSYLSDLRDAVCDDSADLAGLHFDKAAVHASLAIAAHLAAIVKTDEVVESHRPQGVNIVHNASMSPQSSSDQFLAAQRRQSRVGRR